jgi:hypothetical protein
MKRRDFILSSTGVAGGILLPRSHAATPCPPPVVSAGSSSATTTCPAGARSYATDFAGSENPLSEGGVWQNHSPDLTKVVKVDGYAHGTQTGHGGFDDSSAYLAGFPPNQSISAVVRVASNLALNPNREVELLVRWADRASPNSATGYEVNVHHRGAYLIIGRFKGAELGRAANPPVPKTGDVFKVTAVGNVITAYWNGVVVAQVVDSAFPIGNPGIGFYIDPGARNDEFGFTNVSATSL